MSDTVVETQVCNDPWEVADNAKPREFEYYGQVKADVWFGFFPGGGAKPIPFDPTAHPEDKRITMIDIQIIPIAEQSVSFDIRKNYTHFDPDWTKITLPSIKALGADGLRALNNQFVRVVQVDGKKEKKDDTGKKTGEFFKTFKFLDVYPDQAACENAYAGNGHSHTEDTAPVSSDDAEKNTALAFAKVIVQQTVKGETDPQKAIDAVSKAIAGFPTISKYFTGSSPEIFSLIQEAMTK